MMQQVDSPVLEIQQDIYQRLHNFGLGVLTIGCFMFDMVQTFYYTALLIVFEVLYVFVIRRFTYEGRLLRGTVFKWISHAVFLVGILLLILSLSSLFFGYGTLWF